MSKLFLRSVGLILCLAAIPKIRHPGSFSTALRNYGLFPEWSMQPLVYLVPALELLVGIALIGWLARAAQWWALFLFAGFTLVLGWARWHNMTLTCGCFGKVDQWLHRLPHGLMLHLLGTLAITLGLAFLLGRGRQTRTEP